MFTCYNLHLYTWVSVRPGCTKAFATLTKVFATLTKVFATLTKVLATLTKALSCLYHGKPVLNRAVLALPCSTMLKAWYMPYKGYRTPPLLFVVVT